MKTVKVRALGIVLFSVLFSVWCSGREHVLFKNGHSAYSIVLPEDASTSEKTAARELHEYLRQIGGAELPVVTASRVKGPAIYVGFCDRTALLPGVSKPAADDDSFTYRNRGRNLYIWGGSERGTMYGVFSFLEQQLGVRWYSPQKTVVPPRDSWGFRKLDHSESPALMHRQTNYYSAAKHPAWDSHNRLNALWDPVINEYGKISAYWGAHTMGYFIKPEEFFQTHPEYFSLIDGKRVPNAQRCLSNPDVLQICKERLLKTIDENPDNWVYSLSQCDNQKPCTCENCLALEEKYGGHSGILLWFVNQVADEVKKVHPEKYVGTFAYQYTRQVPKGIVPRDNVVIRLCDIECCFAHPLGTCPRNASFMHDFAEWGKICDKVFIWDYVVNYAQYLAPFPNFSVLAPNIRTFRDNHAIGVFEEAQYQSTVAEFAELRAWVLAKLLWDPEQDTEALVKDFISGYYGSVAPYIQAYYEMTQALVKEDTHFNIYFKHGNPLYTETFISKAAQLLDQARSAAADDSERLEVDKVRMQILYLKTLRNKEKSLQDGTFEEFRDLVLKTGARISESRNFAEFLEVNGLPALPGAGK